MKLKYADTSTQIGKYFRCTTEQCSKQHLDFITLACFCECTISSLGYQSGFCCDIWLINTDARAPAKEMLRLCSLCHEHFTFYHLKWSQILLIKVQVAEARSLLLYIKHMLKHPLHLIFLHFPLWKGCCHVWINCSLMQLLPRSQTGIPPKHCLCCGSLSFKIHHATGSNNRFNENKA